MTEQDSVHWTDCKTSFLLCLYCERILVFSDIKLLEVQKIKCIISEQYLGIKKSNLTLGCLSNLEIVNSWTLLSSLKGLCLLSISLSNQCWWKNSGFTHCRMLMTTISCSITLAELATMAIEGHCPRLWVGRNQGGLFGGRLDSTYHIYNVYPLSSSVSDWNIPTCVQRSHAHAHTSIGGNGLVSLDCGAWILFGYQSESEGSVCVPSEQDAHVCYLWRRQTESPICIKRESICLSI